MGNSFGCSVSGERLVSAARDGDLVEAKMLLECNPGLAKYSTFGGLNSPLHFAASKGHNEIVALLLENGADVSSRNYCGQIISVGGQLYTLQQSMDMQDASDLLLQILFQVLLLNLYMLAWTEKLMDQM
ncbi:E3 ubiquitin-protein ligase XBAT33-like isoform X6 [Vigna radiata var. radiata]|uniref:E3 ubiquitin-protein ligase XBAT33-like isoform X6 n=1 Tax=Vigna radiata var. radiata TaxID=3916 RepID=A0A1S3UUE6_VIGRR|nr:E3 ubiquitin-protein ligase XBAT33-like isoform X6 [Vigna radiata var. radiata]